MHYYSRPLLPLAAIAQVGQSNPALLPATRIGMGRPVYSVGQLIRFMFLMLGKVSPGVPDACEGVTVMVPVLGSLRALHLRNADDFKAAMTAAMQLADGSTDIAKEPCYVYTIQIDREY